MSLRSAVIVAAVAALLAGLVAFPASAQFRNSGGGKYMSSGANSNYNYQSQQYPRNYNNGMSDPGGSMQNREEPTSGGRFDKSKGKDDGEKADKGGDKDGEKDSKSRSKSRSGRSRSGSRAGGGGGGDDAAAVANASSTSGKRGGGSSGGGGGGGGGIHVIFGGSQQTRVNAVSK